MKTCPKCQQPMVAESVGEGKTKYVCRHDGTTEVVDNRGRKYLADGDASNGRRTLLG